MEKSLAVRTLLRALKSVTRHSSKPNKLRNVNIVRGRKGNFPIQKREIYHAKIKVTVFVMHFGRNKRSFVIQYGFIPFRTYDEPLIHYSNTPKNGTIRLTGWRQKIVSCVIMKRRFPLATVYFYVTQRACCRWKMVLLNLKMLKSA